MIRSVLKLIRRVPRVFHALLVLALSTICVTIIFVWVVLWCWPTSFSGDSQYIFEGIGDEIGRMHLGKYGKSWWLEADFFERVTIDANLGIRVGIVGSEEWDVANFFVSLPVQGPRWRPNFFCAWSGWGTALGVFSFDGYMQGPFGLERDYFHRIQMERTGLSEQEVLRIKQLPRLSFSITLPLLFCIVLTGWYPLFLVVRGPLRRRRRARRGWCIKCGYDLTGNESGVCPECGTSITPKTRSMPPSDYVCGEGAE